MKIIKLIKLILLKLIIRLDEALIEAKPIKMNAIKLIKLYLMPIVARSAPNNGRVKEAKVSSCTRGTDKAVNGKAKRDMNERANGNKGSEVRQAK